MSNALIKSLKKSNKKRLEQEAKNKERNAKRAIAKKEKKEYNPFPPEQQPRKIDLLLESGDYFIDKDGKKETNKKIRKKIQNKEKEDLAKSKKEENSKKREEIKKEKQSSFIPPEEKEVLPANKPLKQEPTLDELKKKFLGKKHKK